MDERKTKIHGEVMLIPVSGMPKGAKQKKISGSYFVVAPSEVTGNDHIVELGQGTSIYEDASGQIFVKCETPGKLRCKLKERHDDVLLEPGIYQVGIQQEYDYETDGWRDVTD